MPKAIDDPTLGAKPELTAEDIRDWLAANPDFLDRNADLLVAQDARHADDIPGVVDLRRHILEGLRRSLERQKAREREILLAAEDRARAVARTQDAVLAVLRQTSLGGLARRVASQFPVLFSTTAAALVVEGGLGAGQGELLALPTDAMDTLIPPGKTARLGRATDADRCALGDRFSLVESLAAIRLQTRHGRFALVLGSSTADEFAPDQGTDLLDFLGSVLEYAIDRWPRHRR
ncbi:MAG: DUF484 family protein [Defluviicoccus sp.]|nr:DUF484 family protein [Defluviicoccus sp.]MDE0385884.1 DUF484 family protein [Defluviicoccus sp.]